MNSYSAGKKVLKVFRDVFDSRTNVFLKIDKLHAGFHSKSSYIDHINLLRIIVEQCAEIKLKLPVYGGNESTGL